MSSSSQAAARASLGAQLREMRMAAGLSGRAFAARAGCQPAKVSQVERARRAPSRDDVLLWCRICGASPQRAEELLAEQAAVARLWVAFRHLRSTGLNATQRLLSGDMWDKVRLYRGYQGKVIPGLLQTEPYMTAVLTGVRSERDLHVDDVAEAVTERIGRQGQLLLPGREFRFLVEEPVLWFRAFGAAVQRDQLVRLLAVMGLPSVSLAIIPLAADRRGFRPRESFDVTDDKLVTVEMLTGFLSLTHQQEVSAYLAAWEQLMSIAVTGSAAESLIRAAARALDDPARPGKAGASTADPTRRNT